MKENSFLYKVASDIYSKESSNLEDVLVILPNERAIRFFDEIFSSLCSERMCWFNPKVMSVDSFVQSYIADMQKGDDFELLCLLYKSYCKVYYDRHPLCEGETMESFSSFYDWGRMILNDFDQVDKSLIDAESFYVQLTEYQSMRDNPEEFLPEEIISFIEKTFNTSFSGADDDIRKRFCDIWNCLYGIYVDFRNELVSQRLAYSGMLYRQLYERLKDGQVSICGGKISIVGFSVLNKVESSIFQELKDKYDVHFYWDYDAYYRNNEKNEAGLFVRENIGDYGFKDSFKEEEHHQIENNCQQEIRIIQSPYDTNALSYIKHWYSEITKEDKDGKKVLKEGETMAVILNDETLLPMVLKVLSGIEKDKYNITMGYPFNQSELSVRVEKIADELIDNECFCEEKINSSLRTLAEETEKDKKWQIQLVVKVKDILVKVAQIVKKTDLEIDKEVLKQVIRKRLRTLSADLVSDAKAPLQIMGMLETRTLDFDYVLMLSSNDDMLPHVSKDASFIPYSLRKHFNMPDITRKTAVFAYYFYRLLHNAKRVDYVYSTVGGNVVKEESRFIRQLRFEYDSSRIKYFKIKSDAEYSEQTRQYPTEEGETEKLTANLSASVLNKLITCPLSFYLHKAKGLNREIDDEDYLNIAFGNVFHGSAAIMKEKSLGPKAAMEEYLSGDSEEYKGTRDYDSLVKSKRVLKDIHYEMIESYLEKLKETDNAAKTEYLCSEKVFEHSLTIDGQKVTFKSRLDRMDVFNDEKDGFIRILDYKTGQGEKKKRTFQEWKQIFENKSDTEGRDSGKNYIFEVVFYSWLVYHNEKEVRKLIKEKYGIEYLGEYRIKPELMYVTEMDDCSVCFENKEFFFDEDMNTEFEERLTDLIRKNVLNVKPGECFKRNKSEEICKYCDYKDLCE